MFGWEARCQALLRSHHAPLSDRLARAAPCTPAVHAFTRSSEELRILLPLFRFANLQTRTFTSPDSAADDRLRRVACAPLPCVKEVYFPSPASPNPHTLHGRFAVNNLAIATASMDEPAGGGIALGQAASPALLRRGHFPSLGHSFSPLFRNASCCINAAL